jgi:signal transduction histidine kinase
MSRRWRIFFATVSGSPIVSDPDRVRQIVRNLVSNAHRYGGDTIRVELARGNDLAIRRVFDTGDGVPEDNRE